MNEYESMKDYKDQGVIIKAQVSIKVKERIKKGLAYDNKLQKIGNFSIINKLDSLLKYLYFGDFINIVASSVCQLKCPVCAKWGIREKLGNGYLKFKDFKKFVDRYPNFKNIEIAGKGEMFLNPELGAIMEYSYAKKINLTARVGVNLNDASEKIIEHLVKNQFKFLTISIDGASESTYQIYRRGGSFTKVIDNIKKINFYKSKYKTVYPELSWQFIVFGHNEHELPVARKMAEELNMTFSPSFNADPEYSPIIDKEFARTEMRINSKRAFEDRLNDRLKGPLRACYQLWRNYQISWDGKLLSCSCNSYVFPANVFELGLRKALKNENYVYAKKMLSGKVKAREDIPCFFCPTYKWRQAHKCYIRVERICWMMCKSLIHKVVPKKFIGLIKRLRRE